MTEMQPPTEEQLWRRIGRERPISLGPLRTPVIEHDVDTTEGRCEFVSNKYATRGEPCRGIAVNIEAHHGYAPDLDRLCRRCALIWSYAGSHDGHRWRGVCDFCPPQDGPSDEELRAYLERIGETEMADALRRHVLDENARACAVEGYEDDETPPPPPPAKEHPLERMAGQLAAASGAMYRHRAADEEDEA